jgi:hypothetical protein
MTVLEGGNMTRIICKRCGADLRKGAKFCAGCGAVAPVAEIDNLYAAEPGLLFGNNIRQTVVPPHAAVTEKMPSILPDPKAPSSDDQAGSQP